MKVYKNTNFIQFLGRPENENLANDDLRHKIRAIFIRPDDKEVRDRFELQISSTQIDT